MADLALKNAADAKVKVLAARVKATQGPEITRMAGWLAGGGIPVPSFKAGQVTGHSMAGMGGKTKAMPSKQEMTGLSKATGSGFDRTWLPLMVRNHEGAVATARRELAKGLNPGAKEIAKSVVDRQSADIATMKSILTGIPG